MLHNVVFIQHCNAGPAFHLASHTNSSQIHRTICILWSIILWAVCTITATATIHAEKHYRIVHTQQWTRIKDSTPNNFSKSDKPNKLNCSKCNNSKYWAEEKSASCSTGPNVCCCSCQFLSECLLLLVANEWAHMFVIRSVSRMAFVVMKLLCFSELSTNSPDWGTR